MMKFHEFLIKNYLTKEVVVDCFNQKQVIGQLIKVRESFIVVQISKRKYVTIPINSIALIQERENKERTKIPAWLNCEEYGGVEE